MQESWGCTFIFYSSPNDFTGILNILEKKTVLRRSRISLWKQQFCQLNVLCTTVPRSMFKNEKLTREGCCSYIWTHHTQDRSEQSISMVDGVCRRGIRGGAETDVGELYSVHSLRDVFAGEESPQGPWVYLPSPSSGPVIWQAPSARALPRLQDNKQHHVWLVSEFSGLERGVCIGLLLHRNHCLFDNGCSGAEKTEACEA